MLVGSEHPPKRRIAQPEAGQMAYDERQTVVSADREAEQGLLEDVAAPAEPQPADGDAEQAAYKARQPVVRMRLSIQDKARDGVAHDPARR